MNGKTSPRVNSQLRKKRATLAGGRSRALQRRAGEEAPMIAQKVH